MSTTASRRDISDPEVVNDFAQKVGSTEYMDYLYLLTVADIRATSPSVWNSWKDALLAELYHATRNALRRGLSNPLAQEEIIEKRKADAYKLLALHRIAKSKIEQLWERLEDDYFLRYSADEIAWHGRAILNHKDGETLILTRQQTVRGGTEIFLYTPIKEHQFTTTTTALDQIGLTIVDARIMPSRDHYTLDTYIVLEEDGKPISGQYRLDEIDHALRRLLSDPDAVQQTVTRHMPRQLKHFSIPTQVVFREDAANQRTIMEVVCSDRPGLLSHIARALASCNVLLQNAKIATFGERAEDIFFITDAKFQPLSTIHSDSLREAIVKQLNQ